jgi:hypothetical protein
LDEEEEGGATELLSTSAGLGEPQNDGLRRRPWTTVRFHVRKGELNGGRRRSARERERGGGGCFVASLGFSRELLGGLGGKQEVALATSRSRARRCSLGLNEEDKANLHIAPSFAGFPGK